MPKSELKRVVTSPNGGSFITDIDKIAIEVVKISEQSRTLDADVKLSIQAINTLTLQVITKFLKVFPTKEYVVKDPEATLLWEFIANLYKSKNPPIITTAAIKIFFNHFYSNQLVSARLLEYTYHELLTFSRFSAIKNQLLSNIYTSIENKRGKTLSLDSDHADLHSEDYEANSEYSQNSDESAADQSSPSLEVLSLLKHLAECYPLAQSQTPSPQGSLKRRIMLSILEKTNSKQHLDVVTCLGLWRHVRFETMKFEYENQMIKIILKVAGSQIHGKDTSSRNFPTFTVTVPPEILHTILVNENVIPRVVPEASEPTAQVSHALSFL